MTFLRKSTDRRQKSLQRLFNRARKKLTATSCMACDYDEAEGILIDHCKECCHKIVREMWQAFIRSDDARIVNSKTRAK